MSSSFFDNPDNYVDSVMKIMDKLPKHIQDRLLRNVTYVMQPVLQFVLQILLTMIEKTDHNMKADWIFARNSAEPPPYPRSLVEGRCSADAND